MCMSDEEENGKDDVQTKCGHPSRTDATSDKEIFNETEEVITETITLFL